MKALDEIKARLKNVELDNDLIAIVVDCERLVKALEFILWSPRLELSEEGREIVIKEIDRILGDEGE